MVWRNHAIAMLVLGLAIGYLASLPSRAKCGYPSSADLFIVSQTIDGLEVDVPYFDIDSPESEWENWGSISDAFDEEEPGAYFFYANRHVGLYLVWQ